MVKDIDYTECPVPRCIVLGVGYHILWRPQSSDCQKVWRKFFLYLAGKLGHQMQVEASFVHLQVYGKDMKLMIKEGRSERRTVTYKGSDNCVFRALKRDEWSRWVPT